MKLLFVADLHYALKQYDWLLANAAAYDPIVIGGDLLDLAGALDLDIQIVVLEKYLKRLQELTRVVVSSGNHDGDSRNEAGESCARWILNSKADRLYPDFDSFESNGTVITVCPWWDGPVSRAQLEAFLEREAAKPKQRWVWVHHAPPDKSPVCWTGKKFAGDEFLVQWIQRYQPDLVLSGHIHNAPFYPAGSWIDRLGKTWVFNPGRQPGSQPTYLVFDFETSSVTWSSAEGEISRDLVP
jgi:Icc-related predicted phosphoesterase